MNKAPQSRRVLVSITHFPAESRWTANDGVTVVRGVTKGQGHENRAWIKAQDASLDMIVKGSALKVVA